MADSMTGYGREISEQEGTRVVVEVRSVNHRFLDVHTHLPSSLLFMEDSIRKRVKEAVQRGRVDVYITMDSGGFHTNVEVDWSAAEQYIQAMEGLKSRFHLTGDITIDMVSKLENVFVTKETEDVPGSFQEELQASVKQALNQLTDMRKREGRQLTKDLHSRITAVGHWLKMMDQRRPDVINEYKARIRARIEEYAAQTLTQDEPRILQEVSLMAEKGDVTEEFTRMHSHLQQFEEALTQPGSVGRRLDFILQEMHREVNTMGSKSNDALLMEYVLNMKSELEKMKEQVQNVE
ncbi:YicC/YloC family endoribonuclease [Halobacillus litoralis]|uniref:YicC/YloC family endoribonuclease n=1 Tax=Halobacillus litoralis TaxID=45668 RepID=UPI0013719A6E|nr:YicC/YloC family endoribonuclease [Halobacillus litoralis]MYL37797.1 YicC family protein [Halobacillus litoralis]